MRFVSTSATVCSLGLPGQREASGDTAKMTSRLLPSSAAYRVWDSNSARFEGFEAARESLAALCAGAAPAARKAGRRTAETQRPAQAGGRTVVGPAPLQSRPAQAF